MNNLTAGLLFNDTMVMIAGGNSAAGNNVVSSEHHGNDVEYSDHHNTYDYDSSPCSSSSNSTNSPVYYGAPHTNSTNTDLFTEFEFNAFEFGGDSGSGFLNPTNASSPEEEHSYMEDLISSDLSSDEDKFLESIRYGGSAGVFHQAAAVSSGGSDLLSEEELVNTIQTYGDVKVVQVDGGAEDDEASRVIIEGIERGVVGGGNTRIIEVVQEEGFNNRVVVSKKRKGSVGGGNSNRGVKRVTIIQQQQPVKQMDEIIIETGGELLSPSPGSPSEQQEHHMVNGSFQELKLSEEEKRLLLKEGISLPTHYPLTKLEERELKRIRRKIRNKISAQDSRKRKKEFLDRLQIRVNEVEDEKSLLQKRIRSLESINSKLNAQVKRLQQALQSATSGLTTQPGTAQKQTVVPAATTLLVLILSLALVVLPTVEKQQQQPGANSLNENQGNEIISLLNRSNNELGRKIIGKIGGVGGSVQHPKSRTMVNEHEDGVEDEDEEHVKELIGEMRSIVMRMRGRKRGVGGGGFGSAKRGKVEVIERAINDEGWWDSDEEEVGSFNKRARRFDVERSKLRFGNRAFQVEDLGVE